MVAWFALAVYMSVSTGESFMSWLWALLAMLVVYALLVLAVSYSLASVLDLGPREEDRLYMFIFFLVPGLFVLWLAYSLLRALLSRLSR